MLARELGPCLAVLLNAREVVAMVEAPTAVVCSLDKSSSSDGWKASKSPVVSIWTVQMNPGERFVILLYLSSVSPLTGLAAKQMSIEEATISDGSDCTS